MCEQESFLTKYALAEGCFIKNISFMEQPFFYGRNLSGYSFLFSKKIKMRKTIYQKTFQNFVEELQFSQIGENVEKLQKIKCAGERQARKIHYG